MTWASILIWKDKCISIFISKEADVKIAGMHSIFIANNFIIIAYIDFES